MQKIAKASIFLFNTSDGGRASPTTGQGCVYRPHLRVMGTTEYLGVCLIDGPESILPGTLADVTMALVYDKVDCSALTVGAEFEILEGASVVGNGFVTGCEEWDI